LWDAAEVLLKEKFTPIDVLIQKRSETNNLNFPFVKLENKEQTNETQYNRRKEINKDYSRNKSNGELNK
jgi:hypothetical protein